MIKYVASLVFTTLFLFQLKAQSPNILLVIADDMGIDAMNGYDIGNIKPNTPHLDSLRSEGVTFTNAWSSPVCTPSRAGIMSGMYGSKTGVKTAPGNLDTSFVSIFKALKAIDPNYKAGVSGKWHISKPVNVQHPFYHGADHYMGVIEGAVTAYDDWEKTEGGNTATSNDYVTTSFTNDAINWIDNQSDPWFMWLAHVAPHTPIHLPPAHMYTQPSTNAQIKKYMAMIESLDYEIGNLLDGLTAAEKANTTIIFIGDNGSPDNLLQDYPSGHGKETLYEGGIRVPMVVSGYGVTRSGEIEHAMVNIIDIYATALELAGEDLPGGIYNSLSFRHLLNNTEGPTREYNMSELDTNNNSITVQGFAIRNSTFKLIEYHDGTQEMYNLLNDTLETNDLLLGTLTPTQENVKARLEAEAEKRQTSWSCRDSIKNGDEDGIDCGGTLCDSCNTVSIKGIDRANELKIFPNPVANELTISSTNAIQSIKIYNVLGEKLINKNLNQFSTTIDCSELSPNIYFIQVKLNDSIITKKIIVK